MRNLAGKITRRALRGHRKKTEDVWYLVVPAMVTVEPGRQPVVSSTKVRIYPVEEPVSEREANHYGMTDTVGLRKLLIPGDLPIQTARKLIRNGVDVNITKILDKWNKGLDEYHEIFVHIREEHGGGS